MHSLFCLGFLLCLFIIGKILEKPQPKQLILISLRLDCGFPKHFTGSPNSHFTEGTTMLESSNLGGQK